LEGGSIKEVRRRSVPRFLESPFPKGVERKGDQKKVRNPEEGLFKKSHSGIRIRDVRGGVRGTVAISKAAESEGTAASFRNKPQQKKKVSIKRMA